MTAIEFLRWLSSGANFRLALLLTPVCPIAYIISGKNLWFSDFGLKVYAQQNLLFYTALAVFPFFGECAMRLEGHRCSLRPTPAVVR